MEEISVHSQTMQGALFRMELRRKNIIPPQSAGKALPVVGFADAVGTICGTPEEAVR